MKGFLDNLFESIISSLFVAFKVLTIAFAFFVSGFFVYILISFLIEGFGFRMVDISWFYVFYFLFFVSIGVLGDMYRALR